MDLSREYGIDDELADSGRWFHVDDAELLIAAMPNRAFDRFLELPRRQAREVGKDVSDAVLEEAMAKTVLLSWKNITHDGAELEPTEANRLSMLRKFVRFQNTVVALARQNKNFQRKAEDNEEKNSLRGLNGSSALVHASET